MLIGGLLFLLTSGPSTNNLVFVGMYCIYMVIGAYYEERRLLRIFGDQYRSYRRNVGAFYPNLRQWSALCSGI
jgi:protein-S-isoprenylcysteine O-methyltransferase Ste14